MTAQASHPLSLVHPSPEMTGIEAIEPCRQGGEIPANHDYGVYVLEGTSHPDGSNGLIFSFNPDVVALKDQDTRQIARNIRLSLLPLKRREHELKSTEAGEEISEKELSFRVEANESPIRVIKDGEVLENDDEAADLLFDGGAVNENYLVMHGWPAVRLDYDTSLIDHTSLMKAVCYVLSSNTPSSETKLWLQDMSTTGSNAERLLDPNSVKTGNPNKHIREWIMKIIEEMPETAMTPNTSTGNTANSSRFARIASSLTSIIKI